MQLKLNGYWGLLGFLGFLGFSLNEPLYYAFFAFFLFFLEPVVNPPKAKNPKKKANKAK